MSRAQDLAAALLKDTRGAGSSFVDYGQGVILAWNPDTFENQVQMDGTVFTNVKVASGAEALSYQPGDVVILEKWFNSRERGLYTSSIKGRVISPGTDAATKTVQFLQTNLARVIAREVAGESAEFDSVETQQTTSSTSFADLATVGPEVTVDISSVGRALVQFGCVFTSDTVNDHISMSFAVSGETTQAPSGFRSVQLQFTSPVVQSTSMAVLVTGLNPGVHTITAKYKVTTIGATGFFANRWMIVYPY